MKTAFHTRSSGKQLSYRIEYDARSYKIFYRERFLKLGSVAGEHKLPRWAEKDEQSLKLAIADIEELREMPEV